MTISGSRLDKQIKLALRSILAKTMESGDGQKKPIVFAAFVAEENGLPIIGLKRIGERVVEMNEDEYEGVAAQLPHIWESATRSKKELLLAEVSFENSNTEHVTVGYRLANGILVEMMITQESGFYMASFYKRKS